MLIFLSLRNDVSISLIVLFIHIHISADYLFKVIYKLRHMLADNVHSPCFRQGKAAADWKEP